MLNVSAAEAEALLELPIPPSVRAKLESKLKPADPIEGQLNIIDALEEQDHARDHA